MEETPIYSAMVEAIDECVAKETLDNATIGDIETLIRIATDHEPERKLREIRMRAENEVRATMGLRPRRYRRTGKVGG